MLCEDASSSGVKWNLDIVRRTLEIDYYTDMLCVWAYLAQIKVDELQKEFGERLLIHHKYLNLFGNTRHKIAAMENGFAGYSQHVREVVAHFPHVSVHERIWLDAAPCSSLPVHLVLKAVQILHQEGQLAPLQVNNRSIPVELSWRLREAFFQRGENISDWQCLASYLEALDISLEQVQALLGSGRAAAALCLDMQEQNERGIEGSPTFLLNEGRQKLYGNVGYRVIAANVQELLEREVDLPDWC